MSAAAVALTGEGVEWVGRGRDIGPAQVQDGLTGLANRRHMDLQTDLVWAQAVLGAASSNVEPRARAHSD